MIRTSTLILAGITGLALAACGLDVTSPGTDLEGLPEGLEVELTVEPKSVRQHEPFTVRLTITNTTDEAIHIMTSHGCLALPHLTRGGERVPFWGTGLMCTAAFATHTFPAGETTERVWPIRAELEPTRLGDVAGTPVPKGVYRVRVAFQPFTVATTESAGVPGPVHEAVIEGALRVR